MKMSENAAVELANRVIADTVCALKNAGVSERAIGESMLGAIQIFAKADPDHWPGALMACGVIIARDASPKEH